MAKEKARNLAEVPVEEKLKSLYALQSMLSEIDKIRIQRGELPLEIQDEEDEIGRLSTRIERMQNEMQELKREVSERKNKILNAQASIERYEEQLKVVRNNREYDALTKEIEFQQLDVELNQKKIKEAEETLEQRAEDVSNCSSEVVDRRTQLDIKKSELEEIIAETRVEEDKLRESAKATEMNIEPRLLSAFKRIRKNSRNGLGIVYVQRDACGGCFNKIPPQRQLDIRMRKKIIVCEYCGRIMIDPELAGVKVDKPTAEKPKRRRPVARKSENAASEAAE